MAISQQWLNEQYFGKNCIFGIRYNYVREILLVGYNKVSRIEFIWIRKITGLLDFLQPTDGVKYFPKFAH